MATYGRPIFIEGEVSREVAKRAGAIIIPKGERGKDALERVKYPSGGGSSSRSSRSGGGGSSRSSPPRYTSELLKQSFASKESMQKAEVEYRAKQAAEQRAAEEAKRIETIKNLEARKRAEGKKGEFYRKVIGEQRYEEAERVRKRLNVPEPKPIQKEKPIVRRFWEYVWEEKPPKPSKKSKVEKKIESIRGTAGEVPYVKEIFRPAAKGILSLAEKVPIPKTIEEKYPVLFEKNIPREVAISSVEDTLKFGFFSPFLATTAQIETTMYPKEIKLKFRGIEQKTDKGITKTKLRFETGEGRIGVAEAIAKPRTIGKKTITETIIAGTEGKPVIKFPSAKFKLIDRRYFGAIQRSAVEPTKLQLKLTTQIAMEKEGFIQRSAGLVAGSTKKPIISKMLKLKKPVEVSKFVSGTAGFKVNRKTYLFGKTLTDEGTTVKYAGTVLKVPTTTKIPKGISTTKPITIQKEKLASTISAAIVPKPQTIPPPKIIPSFKPITQIPKTKTIKTTIQTSPTTMTKPLTKQKQISGTISKTISKSLNKQLQKQKQRQQQKQRQKELQQQIQKQKQTQKTMTKVKTLQKSASKTMMIGMGTPIITPPKQKLPPIIPIPWKVKKLKERRKKIGFKEDIAVSEGFTARTLGLKPMKIKAKDISKYAGKSLGIRKAPIIVK